MGLLDVNASLTNRTRQLADRNQDLRVLAASAAHELGNPIAVVRGAVELLAQRDQRTPEQVDELIGSIDRHSERIRARTSALLELAGAIEAGPPDDVADVATAVATAVAQTRERLAGAQGEQSLAVAIDVPDQISAQISSIRLERILDNLLWNAVKYGGPNVTIEASRRPHSVDIAVTDDGPGVPAGIRQTLFEPFRRGDNAAGHPGSGVGLAIVDTLCKLHGGSVTHEDANPGARFVVSLPVRE